MKRLLGLFFLVTLLVQSSAEVLTQPTPAEISLEARVLVKDFYAKSKFSFVWVVSMLAFDRLLESYLKHGFRDCDLQYKLKDAKPDEEQSIRRYFNSQKDNIRDKRVCSALFCLGANFAYWAKKNVDYFNCIRALGKQDIKAFQDIDRESIEFLQDLNSVLFVNLAVITSIPVMLIGCENDLFVGIPVSLVPVITYKMLKLVVRARKLVQKIEEQEALERKQYFAQVQEVAVA